MEPEPLQLRRVAASYGQTASDARPLQGLRLPTHARCRLPRPARQPPLLAPTPHACTGCLRVVLRLLAPACGRPLRRVPSGHRAPPRLRACAAPQTRGRARAARWGACCPGFQGRVRRGRVLPAALPCLRVKAPWQPSGLPSTFVKVATGLRRCVRVAGGAKRQAKSASGSQHKSHHDHDSRAIRCACRSLALCFAGAAPARAAASLPPPCQAVRRGAELRCVRLQGTPCTQRPQRRRFRRFEL